MRIETDRLYLQLQQLEEVKAMIESMNAADRAELSADWLAQVNRLEQDDPWVLGFKLQMKVTGVELGRAGFKGPASSEGVVEVAYGVQAEYEGNGYATEAAKALLDFAFQHDFVTIVRAHTLPETNASTRILGKLGFEKVGEIEDVEDGLVWRWETRRPQS